MDLEGRCRLRGVEKPGHPGEKSKSRFGRVNVWIRIKKGKNQIIK
jgi:hypothetical protein